MSFGFNLRMGFKKLINDGFRFLCDKIEFLRKG